MAEADSWTDLTVRDAAALRDFYSAVAGWKAQPVSMGAYCDYTMVDDRGPIAGICHAQGPNAGLPSFWLPYFRVACLDESLKCCGALGGSVVQEPRPGGPGMRYAVLQDPAGAFAALFEQAEPTVSET